MIIAIENYLGETIGALRYNECDENGNFKIYDSKNISIADIDYDDIFNTNDRKLRLQFENNYIDRNDIAEKIVADIISVRGGQGLMYDEEILQMFVNDYFIYEMEKVSEIIDEKMREYLDNDGITII